MMKNERDASMHSSMYRPSDASFDYRMFTWIPEDKSFVIEVSTLLANCGKRIPFIVINGKSAIRIQGKKSVKDFVWSHNIYSDPEEELCVSVYKNGDLTLHVLND